ncbi:MAG: phosphate/phosphite/phosphonate ABC transporter substrate-binding protein [Deltaproteobacteria bacterium]|nr:phosphate/phosphite/phosphonate ABC transporter substrate-binding protein [Deltaproteobacteria bacterium]
MAAGPNELTFAVTPHLQDDTTLAALDEICELVSVDVGLPVRHHCAASPEALASVLATGQAQFGWVSPTLLLLSRQLATMVPLLSVVRQGAAYFHAVIFAAADSGIAGVGDLVGKRAAWVAPTSASGYLVPRLVLARKGVDVTCLFASERFYKSHGAVAVAVLDGSADVGATYAHFEQGDPALPLIRAGYHDAVPNAEAMLLAASGPIPADMIVANPSVPLTTRFAFAGALARLPTDPVGHQALLVVIGAEDFRAVSHQALEELAALMKASAKLGGG